MPHATPWPYAVANRALRTPAACELTRDAANRTPPRQCGRVGFRLADGLTHGRGVGAARGAPPHDAQPPLEATGSSADVAAPPPPDAVAEWQPAAPESERHPSEECRPESSGAAKSAQQPAARAAASAPQQRRGDVPRQLSADAAFDPLATAAAGARTRSHPTLTPFDAPPPRRNAAPATRGGTTATSLLHQALVREGLTGSVSLTNKDLPGAPAVEAHQPAAALPAAPVDTLSEAAKEAPEKDLEMATRTAAAGAMAATIALAVAAGTMVAPRAEAEVREAAPEAPPSVATAVFAAATAAAAATMASVPAPVPVPAATESFTRAQVLHAASSMPSVRVQQMSGAMFGGPRELSRTSRGLEESDSIVFSEDGLATGYDGHGDGDGEESVGSLTEELGVHVELSPPSDDGTASSGGAHAAAAAAALAALNGGGAAVAPVAVAVARRASAADRVPGAPWPMRQASPSPSGTGWIGWSSRSSRAELYRPGVLREGGTVCVLDIRIETGGGWKEIQRPDMSAFGGATAAVECGVAKGIFHRLCPSRPSVKRSPRVASGPPSPSLPFSPMLPFLTPPRIRAVHHLVHVHSPSRAEATGLFLLVMASHC